jgi:superfamily II DNA or RNA helicase
MQISRLSPSEAGRHGQADAAQLLSAGALVRVRRRRWRVVDVRAYDTCQLVTLAGIAPPQIGIELRVLAPFDAIEPVERTRRTRFVRARVWRRACRLLVAGDAPPGALRSVGQARIDVMPHQLEPALAVLGGLGSRVLLADEVGLGKTIQAGIVVSELRTRACGDRVLVLTPAGLREQWALELSERFRLDAHVMDAATLRRLAATLPAGVNPWSTQRTVVASIDYVKRPEVLPAVASLTWDIVVVDEAHGVAGDNDRHAAVSTLTGRAAYVLLLSATPHSGDRRAFAALCSLGSLDGDPLLVFRRGRSEVRCGAVRRVHAVHIRPSAGETRMHNLLRRYTEAILAERSHARGRLDAGSECWLSMSVLHKRALSSAWALARSVERRLAALHGSQDDPSVGQLALPLVDRDGEVCTADEPPAWPSGLALSDPTRERRLLRGLLAAAHLAVQGETKLDALARILRRSREPAVVFTEFRDTLLHVQQALRVPTVVLHGGLTREERNAALEQFSRSRAMVLLATDAAGEGLNLHRACRLVVNLELPWNPMRLEQRIGRVDRIGQERTVHAFHLIAADTGETRILSRLKARIARARADIDTPDPVGADEERTIAQLAILGSAAEGPASEPAVEIAARITPDLRTDAAGEATRLTAVRSFMRADDERTAMWLDGDGPWIMRARRSALRAVLGSRVVLVWKLGYEDACGRAVETRLVPVAVALSARPQIRDREWMDDLLNRIDADALALIDAATAEWRHAVERIAGAFVSTRLAREQQIVANLRATDPILYQPGLFDRRADGLHRTSAVVHESLTRDGAARVAAVERAGTLVMTPPRLVLALTP